MIIILMNDSDSIFRVKRSKRVAKKRSKAITSKVTTLTRLSLLHCYLLNARYYINALMLITKRLFSLQIMFEVYKL